jgi:hypothetical protein
VYTGCATLALIDNPRPQSPATEETAVPRFPLPPARDRVHSRRAALKLGFAAAVGLVAPVAITAQAGAFRDRDCSDFRTQRQAQRFFKKQGGPREDPHNLDSDNDGKACEHLPRR